MATSTSSIQEIAKDLHVLTAAASPNEFGQYLQRWSDINRHEPAAILLPKSEDECRKAVQWAASNKIPFTTKSKGLSLYSSIDKSGVVIDLSNFSGFEHDKSSQTAVLKGSVDCKTVAVELAKDGCCTTLPALNAIGAIPFFLNGGNSKLVSQLGYASDLILSARLITAEGKLIHVDEKDHSDLLYAIRGAGQYFGLVTHLTIRTSTFEQALDDPRGMVWDGRFIFPLDRVHEVCEVMRESIVSNGDFVTDGLIMIGAPPPARKPGIAVLTRLISANSGAAQAQAFKPLYDLKPLMAGGSEVPIQNGADALDPLSAPGGYKKLVLTGLYDLEPALFAQVAEIWKELVAAYPDAIGTYFSFQWDSRLPKKPAFSSANSAHGIRLWANNLTWCTEASSVEGVQGYLDRVIEVLRTNQKPESYVDFANSLRSGPVERRYHGEERLEKLKQLKKVWDPEGVFSGQFLS